MVFFMILSPQITPVAGAESTPVIRCFTSKNAALWLINLFKSSF